MKMKFVEKELHEYLNPEEWHIVKSAQAGDRNSMRGLAELYEHWWRDLYYGDGETRKRPGNPRELFLLAFRWRLRAAQAGDVDSMCWMSVYMIRYRAEFNITEEMAGGLSSLDWQRRAAEAGDRYAMKWMGDVYANPDYEEYDPDQAMRWYEKSADAGCIYAIHEIAYRLENGIGCNRNQEQALSWYEMSAEGMDRWWELARMERKMSMEDLVKITDIYIHRESGMTELQKQWLLDHLTEAERLIAPTDAAEKLLQRGTENAELVHLLRKAKLKLHNYHLY